MIVRRKRECKISSVQGQKTQVAAEMVRDKEQDETKKEERNDKRRWFCNQTLEPQSGGQRRAKRGSMDGAGNDVIWEGARHHASTLPYPLRNSHVFSIKLFSQLPSAGLQSYHLTLIFRKSSQQIWPSCWLYSFLGASRSAIFVSLSGLTSVTVTFTTSG